MKILIILFISSLSILSTAHAKIESDNHSAQKKLAALTTQIEELKKQIQSQKQKQSQARQQLAETEKKLTKTNQTLQRLTHNIESKKAALALLTQKIDDLTQKQNQHQDKLSKAIRLKFEDHLQKNRFLTFHDNQHYQQHSLNLNFYQYYAKAQEKQIAYLIDELSQYRVMQQTAEQEKIALEILQNDLLNQNKKLKSQHSITQKIIPEINKNNKQTLSQLDNLLDEQRQLELLIKKLSQKSTPLAPPLSRESKFGSKLGSNSNTPSALYRFAKAAGQLPLPIQDKNSRIIKNKHAKFIIPAKEGTPVQAIYPGRVIFSEFLRGLGLLVIIDHGEGYMSLYGNNQLLYKKTGDWVNAQEAIGATSHIPLYFEIRKEGRALNVQKWCRNG